jgi:hypothetical protein
MATKHRGVDRAARAAPPRALSAGPAPRELPPEPVGALVRDNPAFWAALPAEAAERLAEALEDESGPTPAMLALFERYGRI